MIVNQDIARVTTQLLAFSEEIAQAAQFTDWELQDARYNGVAFHIVGEPFSPGNPAAGITNYIINPDSNIPIGSDIRMSSLIDKINRKLAIYPIGNRNGNVVEDYGVNHTTISVLGVMTGINHQIILEQILQYFLDDPVDDTVAQSDQVGLLSANNFRTLVHPVYGTIKNVYLASFQLKEASQLYQSVSFQLEFVIPDPSYLKAFRSTDDWQTEVQAELNVAEIVTAEIVQTFSLVEGYTTHSYPYGNNEGLGLGAQPLPLIDSDSTFIQTTESDVLDQLNTLATFFTNAMAYLIQFSGDAIVSSFYNSIIIDFSVLPVYTSQGETYTFSDAQSLITVFTNDVNDFLTDIESDNYDYYLQDNINALRQSVVLMDSVAKKILVKSDTQKTITTTKTAGNLFQIIFDNGGDITRFDDVSALNAGRYFDASNIPSGTVLDILI